MENIVEIYWYDLPEEKQQELLAAGFDNQNVVDGVFPLTEIYIYLEQEDEITIW